MAEVKPYGTVKIDLTIPDNDNLRNSTTVKGDLESVDFSTTDHEGNEWEPSFELTWPEILQACKEYTK